MKSYQNKINITPCEDFDGNDTIDSGFKETVEAFSKAKFPVKIIQMYQCQGKVMQCVSELICFSSLKSLHTDHRRFLLEVFSH